MSSIQYVPVGERGFRVTIATNEREIARHIELVVMDVGTDARPFVDGDESLVANEALIGNLLNYGVNEFGYRSVAQADQKRSMKKAASKHSRVAIELAEFVSLGWYRTRHGWCSSCFSLTEHREVDRVSVPQASVCGGCGEATAQCGAFGCRHMARKSFKRTHVLPYCAEHTHEIRSFAQSTVRYADLDQVGDLRKFDKTNTAAFTQAVVVAGVGAAVVAPMVLFAAPALGGALGASGLIGPALSGAAATSHGLAFLGGGAIAAGGSGMLGGTIVLTASGATLGGTLGAVTSAAYVRDDKSFRIEKLRGGSGTPVIVASGFMTEGGTGWGAWERIINDRYAKHPVYRVHWGAKELKALTDVLGKASGTVVLSSLLKGTAAQATKHGARAVPGLGIAAISADLVANPWHVAKQRAETTAVVLADLLARIDEPSFILIGHSLGARVMVCTARILATKPGAPRVREAHLLGAAIGAKGDWRALNDVVDGKVWNYHSNRDPVLKYVYTAAQAGQKAAGRVGFQSSFPKIEDVDVTEEVGGHSRYYDRVNLRSSF